MSVQVEISLEPSVVKALGRRGYLRLRKIESDTRTHLRLNRDRSVLEIEGSDEAVAEVYRLLEVVNGPVLVLSHATWTELMRTRSIAGGSSSRSKYVDSCASATHQCASAVARIQRESGCRIHVERQSLEARIFGPQHKHHAAVSLLHNLASMVTTESVHVPGVANMDEDILKDLAKDFAVAFQVSGEKITVLGIKQAVEMAAQELLRLEQEQGQAQVQDQATVDDARKYRGMLSSMAVENALMGLDGNGCFQRQVSDFTMDTRCTSSFGGASLNTASSGFTSDTQSHGATMSLDSEELQDEQYQSLVGMPQTVTPSSTGNWSQEPCHRCGASGFCGSCGASVACADIPNVCEACHRAHFCTFCGAAIVKMPPSVGQTVVQPQLLPGPPGLEPHSSRLANNAHHGTASVSRNFDPSKMGGVFVRDGVMFIGGSDCCAPTRAAEAVRSESAMAPVEVQADCEWSRAATASTHQQHIDASRGPARRLWGLICRQNPVDRHMAGVGSASSPRPAHTSGGKHKSATAAYTLQDFDCKQSEQLLFA
jgi:hypothetical protein